MLRVLQLIDSDADFQTQTAAAQLGRGLGPGFEIERVAIPSNYAALAPAVLKLRRNQRADDRLIHAFGRHALAEAVLVGKRIIYTPNEFPSRRTIRWLRSASEYRDLHIVCPTDTMRRELVQGGVAIARCHLIRPGVDFAKVKRRRDDALRSALGFSPDDYVILAAGESDRAAAHHLAAWSVSILNVLDPRYKLLLWGRGPLADRAMRFANRVRLGELAAFAEPRLNRRVDFEELLPAADAVIVTARAPAPTLPIAICMAAGLPIVSTVTPTVAELLEDRHTALFTTKPLPRVIAQRIMDLRRDSGLQWQIADMARTEAYEYFSLTRFLDQFRELYRQAAAGESIQLTQPAPGAGLRFHGRA